MDVCSTTTFSTERESMSQPNKIRFLLIALVFSFVTVVACPPSEAADLIDVSLQSGNQFVGYVDKTTDETHLVLRFGNASTYVLRRVEWGQVDSAIVDGEVLTAEQLRSQVDTLATDFIAPEKEAGKPTFTAKQTYTDLARAALKDRRVTHIEVAAALSNWDADVEADGIIVHVYPLDAAGRVVPVQGGLSVELFAMARVDFNDVPRSRGVQSQKIGRWYHRIDTGNYNANGITLKLPFGRINPETATQISSHGLAHVSFNVPGHGTFQNSEDYIRIRGFAPTRDLLEINTGKRYLPSEGVR
ncbi:MAG: hypothetical protein ACI9HK_004358 [Pirellulaceae bacterium]|jgi:hypothetical protein